MNNNAETFIRSWQSSDSLFSGFSQFPLGPNPVRPVMGLINRIYRYKQGESK